ncbi:translocation/assembly module TamB domain-containing protein [Castellaniella sp.]|uniref:translocation/assembly module TamB domain-containing protein n=1 Tax=Castellaniella sp. TaxID=1955812 RepID=UPI003C78D5AB
MSRLLRMRRALARSLRMFGLWVLPPLVLLLALAVGLVWWCAASTSGTQWLLRTAVGQLDGRIHGVRGTLSEGIYVDGLHIVLPQADIRVTGLHLKVLWPELLNRRLHLNDLSAVRVDVVTQASDPDAAPSEPFKMPALPLTVQVDHLSLGGLGLRLDGAELPVQILGVSTALTINADTASLALNQLQLAHGSTLVSASGNLALRGFAAPWPFELNLHARGQDRAAGSPVCVRAALQGTRTEPVKDKQAASVKNAATHTAKDAPAGSVADAPGQTPGAPDFTGRPSCQLDLDLQLAGSLDAMHLQARGEGEGLSLTAEAELLPSQAFPLGRSKVHLALSESEGLDLQVLPGAADSQGVRPVDMQLSARDLVLDPWLPRDVGATRLNLQSTGTLHLTPTHQLKDVSLSVDVGKGSRWNGEPLSGHVRLGRLGRAQGVLLDPATGPLDWLSLRADDLDLALDLGPDHLRLSGGLAADQSKLVVDANIPKLAAIWPGLPGTGRLKIDTSGSVAKHQLILQAHYQPPDAQADIPGRAPVDVQLKVQGGWQADAGWAGQVASIQIDHASARLRTERPVAVRLDPHGQWQVGQGVVDIALKGETLLKLQHQESGGLAGQWHTQGKINPLVITPKRISQLQAWLGQAKRDQGGIETALAKQAENSQLRMALDWNLKQDKALEGAIHLVRLDGDLLVPGDIPIQLGLETARADLVIQPGGGGNSKASMDVQVATRDMGKMRIQADTPIRRTASGGFGISMQDEKHIHVQAESEDLAWVNLLLDGSMEIGGTVHADIRGHSLPGGRWFFSGPLRGENMSFLMLDQGIRLIQGTLQAHMDGTNVVLDQLRFPAVRRVTPKEWRTATWIAEDPDAQNGYLKLSGQWSLLEQTGAVRIQFHRYPLLQRADRYAMVSGQLDIDATLPRIGLQGKIVADAGWFDLDMLNNIPALDSDVVILKAGEKEAPKPAAPSLDMQANLEIDLGPRFYLTGYGLDSGLVGSLQLQWARDKLTALGALRTRGGAINAYGQHLQLRRGRITFQGDIANPVLDIRALRTDVAVHAGVQVVGTARRPRIDLISEPDVSETEKLTWLLLGHGPDNGGADMSLLLSVGSSFLSKGEPFYKRFGLDELSMRSGELGSSGSILPVESVVRSLDTGASPIEQQFVRASKTLSTDLTASLEQALAQTGTVARLSYRLMRGLQAEVTAGTVSGLALVYRWFSMD